MKTPLFFSIFFCVCTILAQKPLLTVTEGNFLKILENTSLRIDDLVISPSDAYTLSETLFSDRFAQVSARNQNPINSKIYTVSNVEKNFKGALTLYYQQDQFNATDVEDVQIAIRKNTNETWFYSSNPNRDLSSKKISAMYTESVNLGQITLALPVHPRIYPNPTSGALTVDYRVPLQKRLYDATGVLYLQSEEEMLNLNEFSSGTYFLETTDLKTGQSWYHKVIKF